MKRFARYVLIPMVLATAPTVAAAGDAPRQGVDDLRGRWEVSADGDGRTLALQMYVDDIVPTDEPGSFLAGGCMTTVESGRSAPLALEAVQTGPSTYELTILSSIVPLDEAPFIVRFDGSTEVNRRSVTDDEASGDWTAGGDPMEWYGEHHDRRRPHCPAVDLDDGRLYFNADVYAAADVSGFTGGLYESYTNIVSSGVRVDVADGSSFELEGFTDLFSPFVDFVSEFRYLTNTEQPPASSDAHVFRLLDVFGDPIPGAVYTDYWFGCEQGAPTDLAASQTSPGTSVTVSWTAVATAPGFDPGTNGGGFYQFAIDPEDGPFEGFGASGIAADSHVVPWQPFTPGGPGAPDGVDFGVSLSELSDGHYRLNIATFGESPQSQPGTGLECSVTDNASSLVMTKDGDAVTFAVGPPPPPPQPPAIESAVLGDFVRGFGFEPDSTVDITVLDTSSAVAASITGYPVDGDGNFHWDTDADIDVGYQATVVGNVTKVLVLEPLTFDLFDPPTDVMAGSAAANTDVWIGGGNDTEGFGIGTTSDGSGDWSVDLHSIPFDLTDSMGAEARITDADGDGTVAGNPPPG